MFALYGLWQLAGEVSLGQGADAVSRGRAIWRAERRWGLPSEAAVQRAVLGHRGLIRLLDLYYAQVHVAALGVCLIWLFARHRERYGQIRNVLVVVTAASLGLALLAVAPPRLVPGLGLVDTGQAVGPSVYPATARPGVDQLSAMPSLHVGWALVVAGALIHVLRSRWRWCALAYPALTWWVVVVTGNHYWADGLVALVLSALATLAVAVGSRSGRRGSLDARALGGVAGVEVQCVDRDVDLDHLEPGEALDLADDVVPDGVGGVGHALAVPGDDVKVDCGLGLADLDRDTL